MTDTAAPTATPDVAWHALTVDAALEGQGVKVDQGLAASEVEARRAKFGPNRFADAAKEPRWQAFVRQYKDPMQVVLLAAGILSLFLPDQVATGVVLIGLTLFNAAMGLNQEGKANASVAALQKMLIVQAKVRRDGRLASVPMEELVPGDIVNI
jgi:P-type Ca2+ transporter type 2C